MRRVFAVVFVLLLSVAAADFAIRAGSFSAWLSADFLPVLLASSASAALVASVVFLTGEAFWFVCMPIFVWCAACTFVEGFFTVYFENRAICGEAFMVELVTLSWEKVLAFAATKITLGWWVAAGLLTVGLIGSVAWFVSVRVPHPTRRSVYGGLLLILLCECCYPLAPFDDHLCKAAFDHLFLHEARGLSMYMDLQARGQLQPAGRYQTSETNLLMVVLIGESSTRAHWSLYGYPRPTTPKLEALAPELIVFTNVTSTFGFTPYALRDLFTAPEADGPGISIPSAARAAGYNCRLLSSQARRSIYQGSGELLFGACHERIYLDEVKAPSAFDDALVPLLRTALLDSVATNQLVFVHTYGSHTPCNERYPEAFCLYAPDSSDSLVRGLEPIPRKRVNDYDNTVCFTDVVLSGLIEAVRETKREAVVLYISDHGETPDRCFRDQECADMFAIPAFVWASPGYRRTHEAQIEKLRALAVRPLTSLDFFPIFMNILGLERR